MFIGTIFNKVYYRPFILEFESKPLPSDCLYRLDLLLMKGKEIQRA